MQVSELTAKARPRQVKLSLVTCDDPRFLIIGWSPDLNVLVVDAQVFDLTDPNHDMVSDPFTIQNLPDILKSRRLGAKSKSYPTIDCQISSCNNFIAFMGASNLLLFRIDLRTRLSTQLPMNLPASCCSVSAHLNPTLPLVAMAFGSAADAKPFDERKGPPHLDLKITNLENMEATTIDVSTELISYIKE